MRIALVGNQGNNAYRLGKWLRESGVDAHVYLIDTDTCARSQLDAVDRELNLEPLPNWIHRYSGFGQVDRKWLSRNQFGAMEIEANFDLALTTGYTGVVLGSKFQRIPHIHYSLGCEVTRLPHWTRRRDIPKDGLQGRYAARAANESLRRASAIITTFRPTVDSIVRLGLASKIRLFGYPEDVANNADRVDANLQSELNSKYRGVDRVFLWLSRLNFSDPNSPEYKGPERFLNAFARLARNGHPRVRAIIGAHGNDVQEFKELVQSLRLESHVDFVPHMPYWKLLTYLSMDNAVTCDEVDGEKGELSGVAREALSVGGVVAKSVDADLVGIAYGPGCPIVNVTDETTCFKELSRLVAMNHDEFLELRGRSLSWAKRYLDYPAATDRFYKILCQAVYVTRVKRFKSQAA